MPTKKSSGSKTAGKNNGIKTSKVVAKEAAKFMKDPKSASAKIIKSMAASDEENAKKTTSRNKVSKKTSSKKK